jgi:hypothetical protein
LPDETRSRQRRRGVQAGSRASSAPHSELAKRARAGAYGALRQFGRPFAFSAPWEALALYTTEPQRSLDDVMGYFWLDVLERLMRSVDQCVLEYG